MGLIRLRGKFKGLFFISRLHKLFPSYFFNFIGHLSSLSRFIFNNKNIKFNDFYSFQFN
jgi:hypothetical protein